MFGSHGPSAGLALSGVARLASASSVRMPSTSAAPAPAETTTNSRRSRTGFFILRLLRGAMDRAADADVRGAAADGAVHRRIDVVIRWMGLFGQQHRRRHELARLAVSALRRLLGDPRRLQAL